MRNESAPEPLLRYALLGDVRPSDHATEHGATGKAGVHIRLCEGYGAKGDAVRGRTIVETLQRADVARWHTEVIASGQSETLEDMAKIDVVEERLNIHIKFAWSFITAIILVERHFRGTVVSMDNLVSLTASTQK
jgi:hypothetical protein